MQMLHLPSPRIKCLVFSAMRYTNTPMLDARLKHVVAAARLGSFQAAAKSVGVTQSAVTKSVADLEREVGYQIFHRSPRGVVLSERGGYFVERAARLLDEATQLMAPHPTKQDITCKLRIGICPPSLESCVVEPLASLRQRSSNLRFELSGARVDRIIQQLSSGAVDVAVGMTPDFLECADVSTIEIGLLETTLFVRLGHPLLDLVEPSLEDLTRFEIIIPSDAQPYGAMLRGLYVKHGVAWQSKMHVVDYFPAVKRLVSASNATAVTTRSYASTSAFNRHFAPLDRIKLLAPVPLCCATQARLETSWATRSFISAMRANLAG